MVSSAVGATHSSDKTALEAHRAKFIRRARHAVPLLKICVLGERISVQLATSAVLSVRQRASTGSSVGGLGGLFGVGSSIASLFG